MEMIMDGNTFKKLNQGPYIKVYSEKEHIPRGRLGMLVDRRLPLSMVDTNMKSGHQMKKLTFTNLENITRYFDRINNKVYICRLEIPDQASILVKSNNFFRTNMCTIQNVNDIWHSGDDIVNYILSNFEIDNISHIPKKCLTKEIVMKYLEYKGDNKFSLKHIPKKFLSIEIIDKYLENRDKSGFKMIPQPFITQDMVMNKFCFHSECFSRIPKKYKTYDFYTKYINLGGNIRFVPKKFRNYDMCMLAIRTHIERTKDIFGIKHIPDNVITEDMCITLVDHNYYSINRIPEKKITEKITTHHIMKHGLQYLPKKYKTNDICEYAISHDIKNITYVPLGMISYEYIYDLVQTNPHVLEHIHTLALHKFNVDGLYMAAYNSNPMAIMYFPYHLFEYELVKNAMKVKGFEILEYVSLRGKYNHQFDDFVKYTRRKSKLHKMAYKNNPRSIIYFPYELVDYNMIENALKTNGYDILKYYSMIKLKYTELLTYDRDDISLSSHRFNKYVYAHYIILHFGADSYKYAYKHDMRTIIYFPDRLLEPRFLTNVMDYNGYNVLKYIQSKKDKYEDKYYHGEKKHIIRRINKIYSVLDGNKNLYKLAYRNNNKSIQFIPEQYHSYILE